MIIKVQQGAHDSWRFYDNARNVQSAMVTRANVPTLDGIPEYDQCGITIELNDRIEENACVPQPAGPETIMLVSFINHDGVPCNLYVNTETYLLNDNGKTIERLI